MIGWTIVFKDGEFPNVEPVRVWHQRQHAKAAAKREPGTKVVPVALYQEPYLDEEPNIADKAADILREARLAGRDPLVMLAAGHISFSSETIIRLQFSDGSGLTVNMLGEPLA